MYLIPSAPLSRSISDYPKGIVLPIDKPYTWTSADVIRKIKYAAIRHFGKIKVGHAGTLDPLATGMLLVCLGAATKKAELLQGSDKEYVAGVSFGATTASFDLEKPIDKICPPVSREALEKALPSFLGEQQQVAPLFSAKSVDGVRAYETARKLYREALRSGGDFASIAESAELRASTVTIHELELLDWSEGRLEPYRGDSGRINVADASLCDLQTASIRVRCSKGTYIRSLARDLGESLGSGAFLSSLRRTRIGDITTTIPLSTALEYLAAEK